ncbi:MAG: hypothetical protein NEA02_17780, partial [Thermoanaerobaculia bacterium]|nr:hypothetical protein [Thermoanaerobaculia bacterium]
DRNTASDRALTISRATRTKGLLERRPSGGNPAIDDEIRAVAEEHSLKQCRAGHLAFIEFCSELGEEKYDAFLRFLYENLAPRLQFSGASDTRSFEGSLRQLVRGCHEN